MNKKRNPFVMFVCLFLLLVASRTGPASPPPAVGDVLPSFQLPAPEDPAHKAYLGLSAGELFQIPQIKADVVIIEIFSMYCPHCQSEALRVNALYDAIEKDAMKGRVKLIGIGANNSAFEVEYFKEMYQVPFPLFPDADMAILNALGGEVRTPYFIALKIHDNGKTDIFFTHVGGFEKADDFLQSIIKASGLK